ncbi:MAG: type I-C CRISPR-associated protein Cas8c/Csd1 [Candidatus Riflebacteria bacterium]|nr:type I-C CRISPR-associated protein Cas8c/Csd1 [Candidatus Riflebacteria bacterium]
MSWIQRLYETYKQAQLLESGDREKLVPEYHTSQNAHINIILDEKGSFKRAEVSDEKSSILLPSNEISQNRVGNDAPHALADTIQYVAKDYPDFGGEKSFFSSYYDQLTRWCDSDFSHPKIRAVLAYVSKGRVIADLVEHGILFVDENRHFMRKWEKKDLEAPKIFSVLPKKNKGEIDPRTALICWTVEIPGDRNSSADTWKDPTLYDSWISFMDSQNSDKGFCFVSGRLESIARLHPAKLRHNGDKAKLISSNDTEGFTFLGRFLDAKEAASVGSVVSQNAHSALRWLIARQGIRNDDQVIVAWAVSGKPIPNPVEDSWDHLFKDEEINTSEIVPTSKNDLGTDFGQRTALKLKLKIQGYRQKLESTEQLSLICLDSATPGRMSINYYREFLPDAYFEALNDWHETFTWFQRQSLEIPDKKKKGKRMTVWPQIAPSPKNIAEAAHGKSISPEQKKHIFARVLPCIVEGKGRPFPFDIVQSCLNRATNPNCCEKWEWERNVGVACALYRGFFARHPQLEKRRIFSMALDEKNCSRDYLYGRLLAVAENLEGYALAITKEDRSTTAERYMQRFAERPFSTWRNIELALAPYKDRLRKNRHGFLVIRAKELDNIMTKFAEKDFTCDDRLSGEFLLAYHCQRMEYMNKKNTSENNENEGENNEPQ